MEWQNSIAFHGCSRMADQDLNRIVLSLLAACSQQQDHLASSLNGARVVLSHAGEVQFDPSEKSIWETKNQFTNETSQRSLPLMKIGTTCIRPIANRSKDTAQPIVDQIQEMYGTSATIFQRMNESGDMLRVATTIRKANGWRATAPTFLLSESSSQGQIVEV